jgi:hypothetical protein
MIACETCIVSRISTTRAISNHMNHLHVLETWQCHLTFLFLSLAVYYLAGEANGEDYNMGYGPEAEGGAMAQRIRYYICICEASACHLSTSCYRSSVHSHLYIEQHFQKKKKVMCRSTHSDAMFALGTGSE